MKTYRVIATDDNGRGTGEEFEVRWQAEQAYEAARKPGTLVTLAEFVNGQQTEIVRDTRFEQAKQTTQSHSQRS